MKVLDLCTFAPKSNIKAGDAVDNGSYVFFTSSVDESKRYHDFLFDAEGIIMGTGGNATLHYYSGKFAVSTDCLVLLPSPKVNGKYFYYFFKANMSTLEAGFKGAGLKHTSKKYIGNIEVNSIPSINEQEYVVAILDNIEGMIVARKRQISLLDDLVKSRFVEMFGTQSGNEKRFPYKTIGDVAEIFLGLTHTPEYTKTGVKFISAKNTSGDFLNLDDVKYISREEFEKAPVGAKPQLNDVLFSRVGSNLGHPVILDSTEELCTFVSLGFLRSKGSVTSVYLKHWMRDDFFETQVSLNVSGGGQPNLNTGWLRNFKIIVPPLSLQEEFSCFVNQVNKSKLCDCMEAAA